jgi:hypothetical protein
VKLTNKPDLMPRLMCEAIPLLMKRCVIEAKRQLFDSYEFLIMVSLTFFHLYFLVFLNTFHTVVL